MYRQDRDVWWARSEGIEKGAVVSVKYFLQDRISSPSSALPSHHLPKSSWSCIRIPVGQRRNSKMRLRCRLHLARHARPGIEAQCRAFWAADLARRFSVDIVVRSGFCRTDGIIQSCGAVDVISVLSVSHLPFFIVSSRSREKATTVSDLKPGAGEIANWYSTCKPE